MRRYTNTMVCCVFFFLGLFLRAPFAGAFLIDEHIVWTIDQSPIYVDEDVIISESGSLTVESGVSVIFDADIGIQVYGSLNISGTQENSVNLFSEDDYWGGISATGEGSHIIMQHAIVQNASQFLVAENSNVELEHMRFAYNSDVIIGHNSNITIRNSLFENNELVLELFTSEIILRENIFTDNVSLGYVDFYTNIQAQQNSISGGDTPALVASIPDYNNHAPFHKEFSGDIPFYFYDSLIVPPDSAIHMQKGVQIFFDSSAGIIILGDFSMQGDMNNPVVLGSSARLLDYGIDSFLSWNTWQGITFIPLQEKEYTLQQCVLYDMRFGIFIKDATVNIHNCEFERSIGVITDNGSVNMNTINAKDIMGEFVVGYHTSNVVVQNADVKMSLDAGIRDIFTIFNDSFLRGESLQLYPGQGSAISVFNNTQAILDTVSIYGNNEGVYDLVNIFNSSSGEFHNVIFQDGQRGGISVFNSSRVEIVQSILQGMQDFGVWLFDGNDIPMSRAFIHDSVIQNNSIGIFILQNFLHIRNSQILDNTDLGAHVEVGGTIDARENNWGDTSGPFHAIKNPHGQGDKISDFVRFVPWVGYDALLHKDIHDNWDIEETEEGEPEIQEPPEEIIEEEEEIEEDIPIITSESFWAPITDFPGGISTMRSIPSLSGQAIKTFPNDWIVYVQYTMVQESQVFADGYRWFFIRDATDGATGWMPGKTADGSVEFLPFISGKQEEFEYIASHIFSTKAERAQKIIEIVDHYYQNTDTKKSLYSGKDVVNFSRLSQIGMPKEVIYAIAAQESGGDRYRFNNEHVSPDYGHGIMQITFHGRWKEPNKWLENGWDNRGKYSQYFNSLCRNINLSLSSKNKEIGLNEYYDCYHNGGKNVSTEKPYKPYKDNPSNPTYKQYTNTLQSMHANIKDALGVLQVDKYRKKCPQSDVSFGGLAFSCNDIEKIIMVWGYNGWVTNSSVNYLREVANKLANLGIHFSGVSYVNNDKFIEKMRIANDNRINIKVFSPVEFFVQDSLGNRTGAKDGIEFEEIPNSGYSSTNESVVIFFSENNLSYELVGTDDATYGIIIESVIDGDETTFQGIDIPIIIGERHVFEIDWGVVADGRNGVQVSIDKDGNGEFEEILYISGFVQGDFPREKTGNTGHVAQKNTTSPGSGGMLLGIHNDISEKNVSIDESVLSVQPVDIIKIQTLITEIKKPIAVIEQSLQENIFKDNTLIVLENDSLQLQARADIAIPTKKIWIGLGIILLCILTFIGIRKTIRI